MKRPQPLRWTRRALLLLALSLTAIGVIFVHSTTAADGEAFPGPMARAQVFKALVALGLFLVVSRFDYRLFGRFAYIFYAFMLCGLSLLLLRRPAGPTSSWIDLGMVQVQPSELMKVAVILCLAQYLRYREDYRRAAGLVVPYLLVFLPMALVALQPDLGTSLMLPPVLIALLYVARARLWPLALTVAVGAGSLPAAFFLRDLVPLVRGYQLRRIVDFFEGEGYQFRQSLISLGSGGWTGRSWVRGVHLPEKHTDFIFAVIGEEWGFIGAAAVVLLYVLLIYLCLRVAIATREPFGRLVAAGVGVLFAAQSFQNIGMTMGLTPITGLPLPFVSHGGSSLVSSFCALALVTAVASRQVRVVASRDLDPQDRPRRIEVIEKEAAGAMLSRWPV